MVLRTQLEVPTEDLPFLRMVLVVLDIMVHISISCDEILF